MVAWRDETTPPYPMWYLRARRALTKSKIKGRRNLFALAITLVCWGLVLGALLARF